MNIEEAIKTSIEYETRVRELYVEALEEATDPVAQRLFRLLADEENRHVVFLEAKLSEWIVNQQLTFDGLETAVPPIDSIQREVEKLQAKLTTEDKSPEVSLLQRIRAVELETSNFYKRMVAELPSPGEEFFGRFIAIEEGHLGLVEAEIDALTGMGFWFDVPEFDLEKN